MDLSHWKLVRTFTADEAAHLAAGIDPLTEEPLDAPSQARIALFKREILAAFHIAYMHAWEILQPLRAPPEVIAPDIWEYDPHYGELPSLQLRQDFAVALANPVECRLAPYSDGFDRYPGRFASDELAYWFAQKDVRPAYDFTEESCTLPLTTRATYNTPWLSIVDRAITEFMLPRRNPDAKREEIVDWINQAAAKEGIAESDRIAKAIFTIVAPSDHNPRRRR